MVGTRLPITNMEHQYLVTEMMPSVAALDYELPMIRDTDSQYYLRQEGQGLLLGPWEQDCRRAWDNTDGRAPWSFGQELLEDDWNRLGYIAATLGAADFDAVEGMDLIGKLFAEDDVRVFTSKPVSFRCRCSRRRAEEVLRMLGETETREVAEERGRVDVTCEYCGRQRSFDAIDVSRLFADNVVSGPDSVQ